MGPGLITGAADDDPSGIATYSQAGAQFGLGLAWTMLFTFPLLACIQEISARIGRTTGQGIAANLRDFYPRPLLLGTVGLLTIANTINLGADLGAMGEALKLLMGGAGHIYVIAFGLFCATVQIFVPYARYVYVLKWLTLSLPACPRMSRLFSLSKSRGPMFCFEHSCRRPHSNATTSSGW